MKTLHMLVAALLASGSLFAGGPGGPDSDPVAVGTNSLNLLWFQANFARNSEQSYTTGADEVLNDVDGESLDLLTKHHVVGGSHYEGIQGTAVALFPPESKDRTVSLHVECQSAPNDSGTHLVEMFHHQQGTWIQVHLQEGGNVLDVDLEIQSAFVSSTGCVVIRLTSGYAVENELPQLETIAIDQITFNHN